MWSRDTFRPLEYERAPEKLSFELLHSHPLVGATVYRAKRIGVLVTFICMILLYEWWSPGYFILVLLPQYLLTTYAVYLVLSLWLCWIWQMAWRAKEKADAKAIARIQKEQRS